MRNSFLQAKQLTSATTGRFGYVLQTKSAENSWNNGGPITSSSTVMVHWRILIHQCNNILLLKTYCDHTPPTHSPNLDPHEFSFLRIKSQLWGHCWQNVSEILNSCWRHNVIQKVTSSTGRSAGHVASTQKGTSGLKVTTTNKKKQAHISLSIPSRNFWICPHTLQSSITRSTKLCHACFEQVQSAKCRVVEWNCPLLCCLI
jgi:hypothetical protein